MRKGCLFLAVMLVVMAEMILLPSWAQSEFYVGAYLGPSFASSIDPDFEFHDKNLPPEQIDPNRFVFATRTARGVSVDPALLLGGKIGYWFTQKSIFGLQMPSWLKYFGFEVDVSYQSLRWPRQEVTIEPINTRQVLEMDGSAITVAFLFLARYGFYRDADVPLGRLQPYVGIGPAVVITSTKLNIGTDFRSTEGDLGLAVETGLRYMIHPKFSLNAAFRYRYLPTHVDVDDRIFDLGQKSRYIAMRTTYQMFDLMFGVAYYF
ncbi:MAG: outer membrane beta-barrel protein [Deltaproteobacteria bacterium]|nr:outer membrane beta-barrel protein [Deltaproteobacteria bacterium]